jgi:hypothetical protein
MRQREAASIKPIFTRGLGMSTPHKVRLTRRDMLKVSAGGAGLFALTASGFAVPKGVGAGGVIIEAFPTSPLILRPFNDPLKIPQALAPTVLSASNSIGGALNLSKQDSLPPSPNNVYKNRYGATLRTHQVLPGQGATAGYPFKSMLQYDCRLDDGVTPHQDAHNGGGETHPEWWGKTFFRHFPNHGFVGDIFTVNGTAYPVLEVKQRKYRLRFLDASVSRIYDFKLMRSSGGPKSAKSLGYTGDELQGQYRLPDGQLCMKLVQIANEGGLLPGSDVRNHFELWPAKRRQFIVDFTRYSDGTLTKSGDEIYLVNTMKMTTGRMWDPTDPAYKVPVMKIVIGGPPPEPDLSVIPAPSKLLRAVPDLVPGALAAVNDQTIPTFELQRGEATTDPEIEWFINGLSFDPARPMISPKQGSGRHGGFATAVAAGSTPCTCTWRSTRRSPATARSRPTPGTRTTAARRTSSRSTRAKMS